MATDYILALLMSERDKLNSAIEALQGSPVKHYSKPSKPIAPTAPIERKLSAAGRRSIIAAAKKRWAAIRAAQSAPAPAPERVKTTPAKAPASAKKKQPAVKKKTKAKGK
jgi:hypothetical protein